jgi:hypothetical protein
MIGSILLGYYLISGINFTPITRLKKIGSDDRRGNVRDSNRDLAVFLYKVYLVEDDPSLEAHWSDPAYMP